MGTSGYQSPDLDDVKFYWENDQLDVDAVFRPSIDSPFCASIFNDFEICSMAENPILIDREQGKKISPPLPTTLVSGRPTQPLVLIRNCPFGTGIEKVLIYNYSNLFEYFISLLCRYFNINSN